MEQKTLAQWRKFRNITQLEMAYKMEMSITTFSNYENGHTFPAIDVAIKIVDILGITLNDVVWIENSDDKQNG